MNYTIQVIDIVLNKFLPFRNYKYDMKLNDVNTYKNSIQQLEYYKIDAIKEDGGLLYIFILSINSGKLKNIVDLIGKVINLINKIEIMIIIDDDNYNPKLLNKYIKQDNIICDLYKYSIFALDLPNHILSPKIKILSQKEIEQVLEYEKINIKSLPIIYHNDPQIIWNGGITGQVVEITEGSHMSGLTISLRRIV